VYQFLLAPLGAFSTMAAFTSAASLAMLAPEITEPQRLTLTLDPGLVLERPILRRLSGLKRKRGQDWLRSLLAQGFLVEGRWICKEGAGSSQRLARQGPAVPATPFGSWLEGNRPRKRGRCVSVPDAAPAAANPLSICNESKPFAHLRKVIG
jgi:hypothetical protein